MLGDELDLKSGLEVSSVVLNVGGGVEVRMITLLMTGEGFSPTLIIIEANMIDLNAHLIFHL